MYNADMATSPLRQIWRNRLAVSRTASTEVRRELHNDEIMQKLKAESQQLEQQVRDTAQSVEREIEAIGKETSESLHTASANSESSTPASDQNVSREGNTSPTKSA